MTDQVLHAEANFLHPVLWQYRTTCSCWILVLLPGNLTLSFYLSLPQSCCWLSKVPTAVGRAFRERSTSEKTAWQHSRLDSRWLTSSREKWSLSSCRHSPCQGSWAQQGLHFCSHLSSWLSASYNAQTAQLYRANVLHVATFRLTCPKSSKTRAGFTPTKKHSLTFSDHICALCLIQVQLLTLIIIVFLPAWAKILRAGTESISIS